MLIPNTTREALKANALCVGLVVLLCFEPTLHDASLSALITTPPSKQVPGLRAASPSLGPLHCAPLMRACGERDPGEGGHALDAVGVDVRS